MTRYVIVGCGPAACAAAETVREGDAGAEILLISFETVRALARPRLVEYAAGTIDLAELESNDAAWFEKRGLQVRLGTVVEGIDAAPRTVRLAGGETLVYDKLLAACGIGPRSAPFEGADVGGVLTMNHQPEAERVRRAVADAERAVVVGGGLLGQDMSVALAAASRKVTLIVREDRPGVPQWDSGSSRVLLDELRGLGIDVRLETEVARIDGTDGRVANVVTSRGDELPCRMVFVAIGSAPRTGWLEGSGVEVNRGIVVNDRLATSVPGIYAAGSCTEIHAGDRVLMQASWGNALAQGKTAGMNLLGGDQAYAIPSDYVTKVGNAKFTLFGAPSVAYPQARYVGFRGVAAADDYGALLADGGVVRGGILVGRHPRAKAIKALQLRDEPVSGLADLQGEQAGSVDEFVVGALGLA